jgi:hypothetical protein
MKTNTDITLYSRTVVNGAEVWVRSVIRGVHWEDRKAANVIASGNLQADAVAIYIPDMSAVIKAEDVIVKGVVTKTISPTYTMSNLRADYRAVIVRSVDTMDYGSANMRHVQIGAS